MRHTLLLPATPRALAGGWIERANWRSLAARVRVHLRTGCAALVPVGHGFVPKGGGWFTPAVVGGAFTLHPLLIAVPSAACFCPRAARLASPVASRASGPAGARWLLSHGDAAQRRCSPSLPAAGAAVCLGWLFSRMLGAAFGTWRMPELRPSISSRWLGLAILILLLVRIGSVAGGNILDVGQASSLGAWRVLHGLHLYGAVSWQGPGGLQISTARTPTARSPTTRTSPSRLSSRQRRRSFATLLPAAVLRRADARWTAQARPAARRAATGAGVRVCVPALPVHRPVVDGADQRCADRRPVRMDHRRGSGASARSRACCMAAAALTKFLPALLALQFLGVRRGRSRYVLTLAASLAAMLAWPLITSRAGSDSSTRRFGYHSATAPAAACNSSIWTYHAARGDRGQGATCRRARAARALAHGASSRAGRAAGRRPCRRAPHRRAATPGLLVLQLPHLVLPLLIIAIIQARSDHEAPGPSEHGAATAVDVAAPARMNPQTSTVP